MGKCYLYHELAWKVGSWIIVGLPTLGRASRQDSTVKGMQHAVFDSIVGPDALPLQTTPRPV